MFLRIVSDGHESLYECERLHIAPEDAKTVNACRKFTIGLEPSGIEIKIEKDEPKSMGVYIMNNDGKTIDTVYRRTVETKVV